MQEARAALLARAEITRGPLRFALTDLTDAWLADALARATAGTGGREGVALLAVGAYGRREPAAGSDLDLLLVHDERAPVTAVAEALWYRIWDTGVRLDHAVRTVDQALDVAGDHLEAALGLLEARHVAGDVEISTILLERVRRAWRGRAAARIEALHQATRARGEQAGEVAFRLEPDLKNGRGGLRDVQAWRAAATAWLTDPPPADVRTAYDVLLDVRGELHRCARRPADRLRAQDRDAVAERLDMGTGDEVLRAVADAGRTIAIACDDMWRRVLRPRRRPVGRRRPLLRALAEGVADNDGEVVLTADPARDPVLPLRAAAAAAQAGLPLAPRTATRLAAEAGPLPQPWPAPAREALVSLLGTGRAAIQVVEALDRAGVMARLIPEWTSVRALPQHNPVHRYTVDRHLLETAAAAAALTRRVPRPDLLLVAALLHDVGKGHGGDHAVAGAAVAGTVAQRMGYDAADCRVLTTVVRHHLLLVEVATRRDIADPATVGRVAEAVGDRSTLALLAALTEADALATGPGVWTVWKARLVAELVARTAGALEGSPPQAPEPLPERLLRIDRCAGTVIDVEPADDGTYRVAVAAPDRAGLLAEAAGVLALSRLDVRAATATTEGGRALTIFTVEARYGEPPDWPIVRDALRRTLEGGGPGMAERIADRERAYADRTPVTPPPEVRFDDAASGATVLEVRAHDRLGLLYRVASVLAAEGLSVLAARVSTLGTDAVDAFYVVDGAGRPLGDPALRARIAAAVVEAVH